MVDLLSSDAGISGVVNLFYSRFGSLPFCLRPYLTQINNPARSTNVLRTDIPDLEIDLTGQELETVASLELSGRWTGGAALCVEVQRTENGTVVGWGSSAITARGPHATHRQGLGQMAAG